MSAWIYTLVYITCIPLVLYLATAEDEGCNGGKSMSNLSLYVRKQCSVLSFLCIYYYTVQ
jgi:hypothetical protein